MITVDKIKENIRCPQFGDIKYGKWGAQKLEIREALKFMCNLYDSMDYIIRQQQERIDKAIKFLNYYIEQITLRDDDKVYELLDILKGDDKE